MNRSWDNWNKYTDNDNKPLHGCIMFMVNLGNTVAPIYDKDGTPLNNPQLTDTYGRTQHQVFIEEDVIAYYYKYIGNGLWYTEQNIDPSDTSKWDLQYTSKSELFINIENESKSTYAVNNIEDLRNIDVANVPSVNGYKIITLMGYNVSGDKEPINYIWDSESTEPDDGGAIIATDLIKGRWIMVTPTEHLDVRHYGVFPSNSQNMLDQTLAIQYALIYANNHGLRLFFDTLTNTQYYHYYKLTNITLNPINQIDVAKGVYFIDDDVTIHSQQTNAFRNDPYFLNGDTTLYSNYAKASWNIKALSKSKIYEEATYIIDNNTHSSTVKSLQGWNVDVEQNISGYTFVQCNVYGTGLITNTSFTTCSMNMKGTLGDNNSYINCHLNEFMFNGSPTPTTVTNCTVDIDDFTHKVNLWNSLNFRMATYKDIDFKNVTIPTDFLIYNQELGDRTYSNFIGTGTSHTFGESSIQHVYRFNNVQGNIIIPGNANNTYVFDNCSVNLTWSITIPACTIIIRDSEVILNSNLPNATVMIYSSTATLNSTYGNVSVKDSTITGIASSTRLNTPNFSAFTSILNQEVTSSNVVIKDSQINKNIYSTEHLDNNQYIIDCYMDNNIFNAQHNLSSSNANTIVRGAWINNTGSVVNPIVLDMTNIVNNDGLHQYNYDNNNGTFLPKNFKNTFSMSGMYTINQSSWLALSDRVTVPVLVRDRVRTPISGGSTSWGYFIYGAWIPSIWQPAGIKFFTIGVAVKRIKLSIQLNFTNPSSDVSWGKTFVARYSTDLYNIVNGMNFQLPDLSNELIGGTQYIPQTHDSPADVPNDSTVIPPEGSSTSTGMISIEVF